LRRQVLINGALLALALVSLAVVWATRHAPTTAESAARRDKLVEVWSKEAVSSLRLRRDGVTVELVRDAAMGVEGDFRIVAPWQERADIATVNALLGSLDLASFLRPAEEVDRRAAGLEPPLLELSLTMGERRHTVRLGGPAPAPAGARYAELGVEGEPLRIVTVSAGVVAELDIGLDKLREPRLFEVPRAEVAQLVIERAGVKVELNNAPPAPHLPSTFLLSRGGARELVDREALERLLGALTRLVASRFVEPERALSALSVDPNQLRLRIERGADAGPPLSLQLGGTCPTAPEQTVALVREEKRPARAGCVPGDIATALTVDEAGLVLSTPFAARFDEVESLTIVGRLAPGAVETKLGLRRKGSAFQLDSKATADVALDAGNQRILALTRARAVRRAPRPAADFDGGSVRLDLSVASSGAAWETVRLAKPESDGSLCMQRELDGVVLCVEADVARAFRPDATLLRGLGVTSFATADLKRLRIDAPGSLQAVERNDDGSFRLLEPRGFAHDGGLLTRAVQAMGSLEAERWVAPAPLPAHGLEQPRLRVRAELTTAEAPELWVGAATAGGFFAKLRDEPFVFVLGRASVEPLFTLLIDRALTPLEGHTLSEIRFTRGARRLTLSRRGDAWSADGLSSARAGELYELARSLRADFAVHTGPARANEGMATPSLTVAFTATSGERATLRLGSFDTVDGAAIVYARLDSVEATFALAASTAKALQDF
jgi:Domain of unknown function (DUF4340)